MQLDTNPVEDFTRYAPMPRVAYAYVPFQEMTETYAPEKGLMRGTIFPELDIPMDKYGKQYE